MMLTRRPRRARLRLLQSRTKSCSRWRSRRLHLQCRKDQRPRKRRSQRRCAADVSAVKMLQTCRRLTLRTQGLARLPRRKAWPQKQGLRKHSKVPPPPSKWKLQTPQCWHLLLSR